MARRSIKIGIDVGGTFTHAVALDADTLTLVGTSMVPTTHGAAEGVARGVVDSMHRLLTEAHIDPQDVVLIAHSTTQATNALLEGDVASVGIVGMGKGAEGWLARRQTTIDKLELAAGKVLRTHHRFLRTEQPPTEGEVRKVVRELLDEGAQVFAVSEAFGVDHRENERRVVEIIQAEGYPATSAAEISQLYGLRVRTRTAVINASMLPKMLETANMTERAVRESGIKAPLMIMRSDGGIMDINEMRRRPILTMLSGPAAGVAAALMYAKVSDGLFLEVGGTSTDISIIKNGRPMVRTGEVGGHRLYVRTLDIRTVGIGGGSFPRLKGHRIVDVGPRSAHIAGLRYVSFAEPRDCENPSLRAIQPRAGDPSDYLAIAVRGDTTATFTFTATEAANVLGLMKRYGAAKSETLRPIAEWLAAELQTSPDQLSTEILDRASQKTIDVVRRFIEEYKLDPELLTLVGGGGGAEAIVPHAARKLALKHSIAENAEVISAIGVALGMIQDTVERSIVNPTDADLLKIRNEVLQSVVRMGAAADSVEVHVEVDTKQKRVLATARGTPEMRQRTLTRQPLEQTQLAAIAARSCGSPDGSVRCVGKTDFLSVFQGKKVEKRMFGLVRSTITPTRVIDCEGIVRLKIQDCTVHSCAVSELPNALSPMLEEHTVYGDAGALQPDVFVVLSGKIIDLSGLMSKDHVMTLLRAETETFESHEPAIALVSRRSA